MEKLDILKKLKPLLGQTHQNGVNDCQLTFADIYYPELADKIRGKYSTNKEGMKVAKEELGYPLVSFFLADSDDWYEADISFASFGDVISRGHSIAICLGKDTFHFDEHDKYKLTPTESFSGTLYKLKGDR